MKLNNWIRLRPQRERPAFTGLLVSPLVPDLGHPGVGDGRTEATEGNRCGERVCQNGQKQRMGRKINPESKSLWLHGMLSSLKKKKKDSFFTVLGLCCCTWDFSGGNEQVGGYSLVAEHKALGHTGSGVVVHRLSCSAAGGVFLDQGSNPSLLHCQVDSEALDHQGSPMPSSQDKQTKQNKF